MHDITIIILGIEALKGDSDNGDLNALGGQSETADTFLKENPNDILAMPTHEWLENVQEKVVAMKATTESLLTECPL